MHKDAQLGKGFLNKNNPKQNKFGQKLTPAAQVFQWLMAIPLLYLQKAASLELSTPRRSASPQRRRRRGVGNSPGRSQGRNPRTGCGTTSSLRSQAVSRQGEMIWSSPPAPLCQGKN